ncbi:hypothetical protein EYF80_006417 [Liparis tanakae]|uniref:Uncharacterized protein n=1 Tax=Liparis tanakae TaxID=230148 RepID=A0A4Z2IZV1_9TELE|nr:hypothetical protein EYF80_006417 [Liparis tanakae]
MTVCDVQLQLHLVLLVLRQHRVQVLQDVHHERHQLLHHLLVIAADQPLELPVDAVGQARHPLRHHGPGPVVVLVDHLVYLQLHHLGGLLDPAPVFQMRRLRSNSVSGLPGVSPPDAAQLLLSPRREHRIRGAVRAERASRWFGPRCAHEAAERNAFVDGARSATIARPPCLIQRAADAADSGVDGTSTRVGVGWGKGGDARVRKEGARAQQGLGQQQGLGPQQGLGQQQGLGPQQGPQQALLWPAWELGGPPPPSPRGGFGLRQVHSLQHRICRWLVHRELCASVVAELEVQDPRIFHYSSHLHKV